MARIKFGHKNFRRASDLTEDEMPPVTGFGRVVNDFDKIVAGIPKQPKEIRNDNTDAGKESETGK